MIAKSAKGNKTIALVVNEMSFYSMVIVISNAQLVLTILGTVADYVMHLV